MINETGIGFSNLLFFIGVVENNEDSRLEGRVQVRAFGVHGTQAQIPTDDLPWATLIIGSHDTNFVVPPLNSWVFGFFLDGREAQQPMILGLIPTTYSMPVNPSETGWGVALGDSLDRAAMSRRNQDIGNPTLPREARGENLEETYLLPLETNRTRNIEIAGGCSPSLFSSGNSNAYSQDGSPIPAPGRRSLTGDEAQRVSQLDNDEEFQSVLGDMQNRHGVTREQVYGIISGESSYNPTVVNSYGYAGLFQFGTPALNDINRRDGTNYTTTGISRMSPANQLRVYDRWLNLQSSRGWSVQRSGGLGIIQAAPARANYAQNQIVYARGTAAYNANPGWRGPDGEITVASINAYYDRRNPPQNPDMEVANANDIARPDPENDLSPTEQMMNQTSPTNRGDTQQHPQESCESVWNEPGSGYSAVYPYNRVISTPGGHVIELDSTQGSERIMIWHPNGTYIQMTPSATTYKSTKDIYEVNEQNHHLYVRGASYITVDGDSHVLVKGNKTEEVRGDYNLIVHGNSSIGAAGQININGGEETQIRSARLELESNVENLNLKVGKKIMITSGEEIHLKSKGVFIESSEDLNVKVGANAFLEAASDLNIHAEAIKISGTSSLDIKTKTGKVEAEGRFDLKTDSAFIESSGNMNLKSSNMFIQASGELNGLAATLKMTGSGAANLTGGTVYVTGGGSVELSGGAVNTTPIPVFDHAVAGSGGAAGSSASGAGSAVAAETAETAESATEAVEVEIETPPDRAMSFSAGDANLSEAYSESDSNPSSDASSGSSSSSQMPSLGGDLDGATTNILGVFNQTGGDVPASALIRAPNGVISEYGVSDIIPGFENNPITSIQNDIVTLRDGTTFGGGSSNE